MQIEMFSEEIEVFTPKGEVWVECPGFSRYMVSSHGRFKRVTDGFVMKGIKDVNGYAVAQLTVDGRQRSVLAHRIVCVAFNGPSPVGMNMVNHIDGNKANNAACNLEWVSRSGNAKHSWKMVRRRKHEDAVDRYVACYNSV
jgi:hypothetical protein